MALVWFFVTTVIGLVLTAVWNEFGAQRFLEMRLRKSKAKLQGAKIRDTTPHLRIGDLVVEDWTILDGLSPGGINVRARIQSEDVELPDDLREIRRSIERDIAEQNRNNLPSPYNGERFAITQIGFHRANDQDETNTCHIGFKYSDYFNFLATSGALESVLPSTGETVRAKYYSNVIPGVIEHDYLYNSFGINLAVVTNDERLVVVRRNAALDMNGGILNSSVNEGISRQLDLAADRNLDFCFTAFRGLMEELGVESDAVRELNLTSIGYSDKFCQYGALGHALLSISSDEVAARIALSKDGSFEIGRDIATEGPGGSQARHSVYFIEHTPAALSEFLLEHREHITSGGLCCFLTSLLSCGYSLGQVGRPFKGDAWKNSSWLLG
jgi:hypothetical protein